MEIEKKEYGTYVKEITPVHSTVKNMLRAFLAGGAVCTIGQACLGLNGSMGMQKETAAAWTTLTLIAASVLLTGFGLYQKIVKFAGADRIRRCCNKKNPVPFSVPLSTPIFHLF